MGLDVGGNYVSFFTIDFISIGLGGAKKRGEVLKSSFWWGEAGENHKDEGQFL